MAEIDDRVAEMLQQVAERLQTAADDIRQSMSDKGINASGRTSASVQVRMTDKGVQLVGGGGQAAPMPTTEIGREGGAVPMNFTAILEQWSRDKGIVFENDRQRRSFAYLLGRRIAREGTLRHQRPEDIYTTIAEDAAKDVADIVSSVLVSVVKTETQDIFKNEK